MRRFRLFYLTLALLLATTRASVACDDSPSTVVSPTLPSIEVITSSATPVSFAQRRLLRPSFVLLEPRDDGWLLRRTPSPHAATSF